MKLMSKTKTLSLSLPLRAPLDSFSMAWRFYRNVIILLFPCRIDAILLGGLKGPSFFLASSINCTKMLQFASNHVGQRTLIDKEVSWFLPIRQNHKRLHAQFSQYLLYMLHLNIRCIAIHQRIGLGSSYEVSTTFFIALI